MYQSGFATTLALPLVEGATTATLNTVPTVTDGRLEISQGSKKERVSFSGVSGSTVTGLVRQLSLTADPAVSTGSGLYRGSGAVIKLVAMHDQLIDKRGSNTFSGVVDFGSNGGKLVLPKYTTAQRDAISSPQEGMVVSNTTTGTNQQYLGGAWSDFGTGSTPNASTTAAGKVEIATDAEVGSQTSTGTAGPLVISPTSTAKISSGATDENKIPVLNATGKVDAFVSYSSETTPGLAEKSTDVEAIAGIDTSRFVTPSQLRKFCGSDPVGTTQGSLVALREGTRVWASTTYAKFKQGTITRTGTYTISMSMYTDDWSVGTLYGRIYKNGVAYGTERSTPALSSTTTFTETLSFTTGDTIEFRYKAVGSNVAIKDIYIKCVQPWFTLD